MEEALYFGINILPVSKTFLNKDEVLFSKLPLQKTFIFLGEKIKKVS